MQDLNVMISVITGFIALCVTLYGLGIKLINRLSKPIKGIEEEIEALKAQLDEVVKIMHHSTRTNRHLLEIRIKQLAHEVLDEAERTGKKIVNETKHELINELYGDYQFFGGNGDITIAALVKDVNALRIVKD